MSYAIDFVIEVEPVGVDTAALAALAERVLEGENIAHSVTLTILTTDDETLQELNGRFLGIDAPTDVLAFPGGGGGPASARVRPGASARSPSASPQPSAKPSNSRTPLRTRSPTCSSMASFTSAAMIMSAMPKPSACALAKSTISAT